ncbi:hypothetical protein [Pseudomonas quasicaspiana]|uniref:hypothetical protein n=1 Tax=Pseudomonas quasicaspiana TaxID=2829821 RepID=UPI001E635569|nr:hypothetical protein [Pseudomonas quasicaspiana]MCD5978825.1 hypothetical protein [Pseudomonas quasicaspiana]
MLILFVVDGISKAFLAVASLVLIKYLSIPEFAQFSIIFIASMMTYQVIGGIVERLYISDYDSYKATCEVSSMPLILIFGAAAFIYTYNYSDIRAAIFVLILIYLCTQYQLQRIKMQKKERFIIYAIVDLLRNAIWLVLLAINFFFVSDSFFVSREFFALGSYAVLAIIANFTLYKLTGNSVAEEIGCAYGVFARFAFSLKYFLSRKNVVFYSVLGGVIPYFPFVVATAMRNESLISTYAAAMRYQAIFSMAIMAVNTVVIARFCNRKDLIGAEASAFYRVLPFAIGCLMLAIACIWYVIPYIDGGKYPDLRVVFVILSICPVISLVSTVAVNKLLAFNCYSVMLKSVLFGFLFMLFFTPVVSYFSVGLGPLVSMVIGYAIIAFLMISNARREAVH